MFTEVSFVVHRDYCKKIDPIFRNCDKHIIYPLIKDYPAENFADNVNPRSHEETSKCFKSNVAESMRETLIEDPERFQLANRGIIILAKSIKKIDDGPNLTVTVQVPTQNLARGIAAHGIVDGGTTNGIIREFRNFISAKLDSSGKPYKFANNKLPTIETAEGAEWLAKADRSRVGITIITGIESDDTDLANIIADGTNTSAQVKPASLVDHSEGWKSFKESLSNTVFRDKFAFEENALADYKVQDLLALLNLFEPTYKNSDAANSAYPTISYSAKGTLVGKYRDSINQKGGYAENINNLRHLLTSLLEIYSYIYENFFDGTTLRDLANVNEKDEKNAKEFIKSLRTATIIKYSGKNVANGTIKKVHDGLMMPIMASLRCILDYDTLQWKKDPMQFVKSKIKNIRKRAIISLANANYDPQAMGKAKVTYYDLFNAFQDMSDN